MGREVVVGLDIGTSAVRAAEVATGGSRPSLLAVGQVLLPPQSVLDGAVADKEAVVSALRRLWKEGGFGSAKVRIGVSGNRAIARRAEVAPVQDSELAATVRFQAQEIVPQFAPEEMLLSPLVTGEVAGGADGQAPRRRVLVAAAHRDLVMSRVEAAAEAGLQVTGVDLGAACLTRALPGRDPDRAEAVAVVGAGQSSVVVHRGGLPLLVRTIPLGGSALTAAVSGRLGIPPEDAEAVKRGRSGSAEARSEAALAMDPVIASIVSEIRAAVDLFEQEEHDEVRALMLTGGTTRLPGIVERFASGMECPVALGRVSDHLDVRRLRMSSEVLGRIDPVLAMPVGLAVPGEGRFDLLPEEVLERLAYARTRRRVVMAGGVVVVLLAAGIGARMAQIRSAQHQLAAAKQQVSTLNSEIASYQAVVSTASQLSHDRSQIADVLAHEVSWPTVLDQLARRMPSNVVLTSISGQISSTAPAGAPAAKSKSGSSSKPGVSTTAATSGLPSPGSVIATLTVQGTATDFHGGAQWIRDLSGSPVFGDVWVSNLARQGAAPAATSGSGAGTKASKSKSKSRKGSTSSAGSVSFSSTAEVTGAAHSTRYASYRGAGQ